LCLGVSIIKLFSVQVTCVIIIIIIVNLALFDHFVIFVDWEWVLFNLCHFGREERVCLSSGLKNKKTVMVYNGRVTYI
jgi:hypothetical protein